MLSHIAHQPSPRVRSRGPLALVDTIAVNHKVRITVSRRFHEDENHPSEPARHAGEFGKSGTTAKAEDTSTAIAVPSQNRQFPSTSSPIFCKQCPLPARKSLPISHNSPGGRVGSIRPARRQCAGIDRQDRPCAKCGPSDRSRAAPSDPFDAGQVHGYRVQSSCSKFSNRKEAPMTVVVHILCASRLPAGR
jgi:hypothetical protein